MINRGGWQPACVIFYFAYHNGSTYPYLIMALNWTMLHPNRTPVPLPNEMTITTVDSGVELTLTIPQSVSSSSSSTAGSAVSEKQTATGKAYLTDQRVRRYTE